MWGHERMFLQKSWKKSLKLKKKILVWNVIEFVSVLALCGAQMPRGTSKKAWCSHKFNLFELKYLSKVHNTVSIEIMFES